MKKFISLVLSLFILIPIFNVTVFPETLETISGMANLASGNADKIVIAGNEYYPINSASVGMTLVVSDASYADNSLYLNGSKIGNIVNGANYYTIDYSALKEGENEIKIMIASSSGIFNEKDIYGTYNLDDIYVKSVDLTGLGSNKPVRMKKYMPITASSGVLAKEAPFVDEIRVGDGWYSDTGLGGNLPNTPVSVGYVFSKPIIGAFQVNTNNFTDGEYEVVYYKNGAVIDTRKFIIDNTAPDISFSVNNGSVVSKLDKITYSVKDTSGVDVTLLVDGKAASEIDPSVLSKGSHTAYVSATDSVGHNSNKILVFNITDKAYSIDIDSGKASIYADGGAEIYSGTPIENIRMYENPLGLYNEKVYTDTNEVLVSFDDKANVTTKAIGNRLPYQSFVIDTSKAVGSKVMVSYEGETGTKAGILLKAWNPAENRWDVVGKSDLDGQIAVELDVATYSENKEIKVIATPNIVYNGSDSILWNSDTQYYTRYPELNELYYAVNNYAVSQYKDGNIGYAVHTGDLTDQAYLGDPIATNEYLVADAAQDILDNANVPNGVVSGNHDIKHSLADYVYYYDYFGEDRYKNFDWYGGSLNNNMHHYDLVSIGAYDFVFMYLGCYKEAEADTIAWANAVCEAYPDRNVVICTHEYLLASGDFSGARTKFIWDKIITPNENVVMVLCGHNSGVSDRLHQVGDSNRYVLEILADYQFADLGTGGNGITITADNGTTLDGEGFVRLMKFSESGQVISTTYSPAADLSNFYPSYIDSSVYDVDFVPANRSITTKEFHVLTNIKSEGTITDDTVDISSKKAFYLKLKNNAFSEAYVLSDYSNSYTVPEKQSYDVKPNYEYGFDGFENISENFKVNQKNDKNSTNATIGFDLLKSSSGTYTRTSGTKYYDFKINSNGSVYVLPQWGDNNENWVTLSNSFSSNNTVNLSTYNRLYFGVTAGDNARWNIYVNFSNKTIQFSSDSNIKKMFGYADGQKSDIKGTWNGYIDLSSYLTGSNTINSIYIVASTPKSSVNFDYLFLGSSSAGKIRFIADDKTVSVKEAPVGTYVTAAKTPHKHGYIFEGWYDANGYKLTGTQYYVSPGVTNVYARFVSLKDLPSDSVLSNDPNYDKKVYKNSLWVTHFNQFAEGSGSIFTESYTGGSWNIHFALSPTDVAGTYEITAISNGLNDGSATPLAVPNGGFVYAINRGNDYIKINGYGTDYTSIACDTMLQSAKTWKIGDKLSIGGLSVANKAMPTVTPHIEWYYDDYVCTATYALNYTESIVEPDPEPVYHAYDVNRDGKVNLFDYMLVKSKCFGTPVVGDEFDLYDVNDDGKVNMFDYMKVKSYYFNQK